MDVQKRSTFVSENRMLCLCSHNHFKCLFACLKYRKLNPAQLRFRVLKDYANTGYRVYCNAGSIFNKAKIRYKSGNFPNNTKSCAKILRDNLNKGYPIILIAHNRKRNVSKPDKKWAMNAHTMIAAGLTTSGKVILVDSAMREWSKGYQRFKLVSVDEISSYLGLSPYRKYYIITGTK